MASESRGVRVMIMAGGTGGHVFPALAVAEALKSDGCIVEWLGTERGIEATVVPENDITLHHLNIAGIRGKGLLSLIAAPLKILRAILEARTLFSQFKPDLVIGLGGYVAGPGGLAAWLSGIPLVIHEQNAVAGTTNRLLSRVAKKVLTGFPHVFSSGEFVGNPVRNSICAINNEPSAAHVKTNILVMGGSLGAAALNRQVPLALSRLANVERVAVFHQSGKGKFEETEKNYSGTAVNVEIADFIHDMAERLSWADIVICRAGALTVAELSNTGVASILVPFPHAIDDHQTANARWLVDVGAAVLLPQHTITPENLASTLDELIEDKDRISSMAKAAKRVAKPDATQRFKEICLEVANV